MIIEGRVVRIRGDNIDKMSSTQGPFSISKIQS